MSETSDKYQIERQELTTLWAVVNTLLTMRSADQQGPFLLDWFTHRPYLVPYFRAAYCESIRYRFTPTDAMQCTYLGYLSRVDTRFTVLRALRAASNHARDTDHITPAMWLEMLCLLGQCEFVELANRILSKRLDCGLSHSTLNKVLNRAGLKPLTLPATPREPVRRALPSLGPNIPLPYVGDVSPEHPGQMRVEFHPSADSNSKYILGKLFVGDIVVGEITIIRDQWRQFLFGTNTAKITVARTGAPIIFQTPPAS